jgi:hypothetical protein
MDIKDLKTAWNAYSSKEVDSHLLGGEAIDEMLRKRTKSLVERIDRNIRIGSAVLLAFVAFVLIDDLFLSKILIKAPLEYPAWLVPIDVLSNALIVLTFLLFVFRYLRIKRNFSPDKQLKDFLNGILVTLQTYRRMFYMAVFFLIINIVISFSAGLYEGFKMKADLMRGGIENLPFSKVLMVIGVGLLVLIPMVLVTYFILRWGFNKLYGRYQHQIIDTLDELDETEEVDSSE